MKVIIQEACGNEIKNLQYWVFKKDIDCVSNCVNRQGQYLSEYSGDSMDLWLSFYRWSYRITKKFDF